MHFRNVKQMTSYLMFDVYRFSNMILANEHRSLGPIFYLVLLKGEWEMWFLWFLQILTLNPPKNPSKSVDFG